MEEVLKILSSQNEAKKPEQEFEDLASLFIALIAKRVEIKYVTEENIDELFGESEYASFWKKMKEVYLEKNLNEKNQKNKIIKKATEIQKFSEENISSALIYLIDYFNKNELENINNLISKIINISPNSKIADAFGKKGFLSLELMKKNNAVVDYYETNGKNMFKAIIRFCVFNEMCNIVECMPGVLKKTKYDLVIANPEKEINLIAPLNNKEINYDNLKVLIDEENINNFKISNDMSPYFFISLIIVSMLKKDGKAIISIPTECLYNNANENIRKYFIENYLDEIIILPDHIYPYMKLNEDNTQFALLIFKKDKQDNEIKYSNLEYCYTPRENYNEIDIEKSLDKYNKNIKKISREKIIKNNYSLDPEKYVKDIDVNFAVNLEEITTDIFRGYQFGKEELNKMKPKKDEEINYRIFKNDNEKTIGINSRNKNLDRYLLKSGDILINARGEENTIYSLPKSIEESKYIAMGSTIVIRPDEEKINSKYLELFLKNKKGNFLLNKIKNKNAIYVGNLKKLKISCPEKEKQEKIINKITKLEKELLDIKNSI